MADSELKRIQELADLMIQHPMMALTRDTFDTRAAYLDGLNTAVRGKLLDGFRAWLKQRVGRGDNLGWPALVLMSIFPGEFPGRDLTAAEDELARNELANLISEFWKDRDTARAGMSSDNQPSR